MDALEIQDAIADVPGAPSRVEEVGRALARELLDGGETPLWNELQADRARAAHARPDRDRWTAS